MRRTRVVDALRSQAAVEHILVKGWVRTRRDAKGVVVSGNQRRFGLA